MSIWQYVDPADICWKKHLSILMVSVLPPPPVPPPLPLARADVDVVDNIAAPRRMTAKEFLNLRFIRFTLRFLFEPSEVNEVRFRKRNTFSLIL